MPPGTGEPGLGLAGGPAGGRPPILGYRPPPDRSDARPGEWRFALYAIGFVAVPFALVVATIAASVLDRGLPDVGPWATLVPPVGVLAAVAALSRRPRWRWVWRGMLGCGIAVSVVVVGSALVGAVAWLSRR